MNTKATIDKDVINQLPEKYKEMGKERFFLYAKKDRNISNLADYLMAKYGVLPAYRNDYKSEMNHLIALDKALRRYKGGKSTFWTYINLVMSCNILDYARQRANNYKKYAFFDNIPQTDYTEDDYDVENDITDEQLTSYLWNCINNSVGDLSTEIIKLKAAGFNDREIRKRLKVKQDEITNAEQRLYELYQVNI